MTCCSIHFSLVKFVVERKVQGSFCLTSYTLSFGGRPIPICEYVQSFPGSTPYMTETNSAILETAQHQCNRALHQCCILSTDQHPHIGTKAMELVLQAVLVPMCPRHASLESDEAGRHKEGTIIDRAGGGRFWMSGGWACRWASLEGGHAWESAIRRNLEPDGEAVWL